MSEIKIGRLIRSSSTDFVFGATIPEKEVPAFGSFVRSSLPNQQGKMFGVIFNLTILNSEFLRRVATADIVIDANMMTDLRASQLPIEVSVLSVGYQRGERIVCGVPPQPPISLEFVELCSHEEISALYGSPDLVRLILHSRLNTADDLLLAVIERQLEILPASARQRTLHQTGRVVSQYLQNDFNRMDVLLGRLEGLLSLAG
ncbi:MAG TPA: hypothetical protein PK299_04290 [Anaerolineales bacterium]|nr:hypothetical protein [Anaerolineales bacterium]